MMLHQTAKKVNNAKKKKKKKISYMKIILHIVPFVFYLDRLEITTCIIRLIPIAFLSFSKLSF